MKLLPLLATPSLVRHHPWAAAGGLAVGALALATSIPLLDAGPGLWASFGAYASDWSFNGAIFPASNAVFGAWARPLHGAALVGVALAAATRPPSEASAWVGGAFVLLTPTAHPWYALWALVPALARGGWGWAAAASFLPTSYLVLGTFDENGAWSPQPWLWWVSWGPAWCALGAAAWTARRGAPGPDRAPPSRDPRGTA